jgi:hypothetical protein
MITKDLQYAMTYPIIHHEGQTRSWDNATPYAIHPIWCAMTFLSETTLPADLREIGYQVLLWHDLLEDTKLKSLPPNTPSEVKELVDEMTFKNFAEEMQKVWERSETTRLLKLYDKVSNLLDGAWMNDKKWNEYVSYTLKLTEQVEAISSNQKYGELNIMKIARAICVLR